MDFPTTLIPGVLEQRYKRFLADVRLEDGSITTVHCPNPGAMMGLNTPGFRCWISDSGNPKRKLRHTLELIEAVGPSGPVMVGINTGTPNKLAEEAILSGVVPQLAGYETLRREVKYGENSRIDILLQNEGKPPCYVEVKNVHLVRKGRLHEFPDCKTTRGAKHLRELAAQVGLGNRAVMLYIIQREDGDTFSLARDLDPDYAKAFEEARDGGVEAYAIRCQISTTSILATTPIPIVV
ncbi:DNA/RNA nuclease SfsA [Pseudahrensia aquimaris]|uniref:Sugar fermentation stimulation protein homolog n=1 Tax=Pseudahrensia aquimaris TaxID=744461 RepID=A0ABW3FMH8_9HYPH